MLATPSGVGGWVLRVTSEEERCSSIRPGLSLSLLETGGYMIYFMLITDEAGELVLNLSHRQNRKCDVFYACQ